jgi:Leucine-rich repeat (LRR) protein
MSIRRTSITLTCLILIILIIISLARTNKRVSISEAILNVEDQALIDCILHNTKSRDVQFVYQLKTLVCSLEFDSKTNEPIFIRSVEGIEQFKYLLKLDLSNSRIKTLNPVNQLTDLKDLNLKNSGIYVIEDLEPLKKLDRLNLADNQISNVEELANLISLNSLNLRNNKLEHIEPLSSLINLRYLNLSKNHLKDIDAVTSMLDLKELHIDDNEIESLGALKSSFLLYRFSASNNNISSVAELRDKYKLRYLDLSHNKLDDISSLSDLVPFEFDLEDNGITEGADQLLSNQPLLKKMVTSNPDRSLNLDLTFNTYISCRDIDELKIRLAEVENFDLREPKLCSQKPPKESKQEPIIIFRDSEVQLFEPTSKEEHGFLKNFLHKIGL